MEDPDYDRVLQKYLDTQAALEQQLTDEQADQLYDCVDRAQECMSFEVMHFLRQGFLLGLSVQLGHIIQGLVPPDNAVSEKPPQISIAGSPGTKHKGRRQASRFFCPHPRPRHDIGYLSRR